VPPALASALSGGGAHGPEVDGPEVDGREAAAEAVAAVRDADAAVERCNDALADMGRGRGTVRAEVDEALAGLLECTGLPCSTHGP
jgi:hypothetical protein